MEIPKQKANSVHLTDSDYAAHPAETLLHEFGSSMNGLSHEEVTRRHRRYGYNEPMRDKEPGILIQLLSRFRNPLVIILFIVAIVSLFMGQMVSAILVAGMAVISVLLSFIQEYKANREAKKLVELVSAKASVIREGIQHEVNIRNLVPGDIVYLSAGDIVPADIRVISEKDLYINQATLTGEPFPIEKTAEQATPKSDSINEMTNIAFMGSNIVSGTAHGLVIRTGPDTRFGQLATRVSGQAVETSFDIGVRDFVLLVIRFTIVLVFLLFLINAVLKGNIIEAILFSLAVSVGLTPEMLPMIITVNLSNGALGMSKKRVIVKKLSSIQNLGAMDVLCTDKTGTITLGDVVLQKHFDLDGNESDEVLRYAYLNSYFQTGLKNLLDLAILKHGSLSIEGFNKVDEMPFDFQRKMMSVVVEREGKHILISKGAPEEIIRRCGRYEANGVVKDIPGHIPKRIMAMCDGYRNQGFRVLALAYDKPKNKKSYSEKDEKALILKGFMVFLDPPKPTAKKTIETLQKYGITLKVLTGDNELGTKKICSDVGLDVSGIMSGEMVEKLDDSQLGEMVEKTSVFARLNPIQKERVILALKNNGHTVGFLGDGINDAPSLKKADVGISVANAADIAKETADIILLKKSLFVLSDGVVEGRKTYANILKYIKMGASSNFGNMFSMVGASIFLPFLPMQPIQILLNNFLYDMSQVAIPTDNVDEESITKPTPWDVDYIKKVMVFFGPISSLFDFITYGVLVLFNAAQPMFNTVWFLESLATQTFVIHVIRTQKIPFLESRPSRALLLTSFLIVGTGLFITMSPIASFFGFVQPTQNYLLIIVAIVIIYLVLVQLLKTWFVKRYGWMGEKRALRHEK